MFALDFKGFEADTFEPFTFPNGKSLSFRLNGITLGCKPFDVLTGAEGLELLGDTAYGYTLLCFDFDDADSPEQLRDELAELYPNRCSSMLSRSGTGVKCFFVVKSGNMSDRILRRLGAQILPPYLFSKLDKNALTKTFINVRMYSKLKEDWSTICNNAFNPKELVDNARSRSMNTEKDFDVDAYPMADTFSTDMTHWSPAKKKVFQQMGWCSCNDIENITQERLAKGAGVNRTSIPKILKALEQEGHISKVSPPARGYRGTGWRVNATFHLAHTGHQQVGVGGRANAIRDIAYRLYNYGDLEDFDAFEEECKAAIPDWDRECQQHAIAAFKRLTDEV